jgi:hypothetical protein
MQKKNIYVTYSRYPNCDLLVEYEEGAQQTPRRYSFIGTAFNEISISDT